MVQTSVSIASRRAAGSATAAVLLGAGLACAGNAHASVEAFAPDAAAMAAIPSPVDLASIPAYRELPEQDATLVATVPPADPPVIDARVALPDATIATHTPTTAGPLEPGPSANLNAGPASIVPVVAIPASAVTADAGAIKAAGAVVAPDRGATIATTPAPSVAPAVITPLPVATAKSGHAVAAGDPISQALEVATTQAEPPVASARGGMAKWKPVAHARLDESRGGFDVGGLQVGFGIDRAVYINGALAVATSITIPDVSRITAAQAAQLAQALGAVGTAVATANAAANSAVAAANAAAAAAVGAAGTAGAAATAAANGATATANGAAGSATAAASAAAAGASSAAAGAPGLSSTVIGTAGGQVLTNGLLNVVQNGPGNVANIGAMANMPGTVIQNSLNNQSIQSLMTISASVNTLAAFRAQMANTALNSVIQRAAGMR